MRMMFAAHLRVQGGWVGMLRQRRRMLVPPADSAG